MQIVPRRGRMVPLHKQGNGGNFNQCHYGALSDALQLATDDSREVDIRSDKYSQIHWGAALADLTESGYSSDDISWLIDRVCKDETEVREFREQIDSILTRIISES